jgi:hypothetical protein
MSKSILTGCNRIISFAKILEPYYKRDYILMGQYNGGLPLFRYKMIPKTFTLSLLAIIPAILSTVQASDAKPSSTEQSATATPSPMCLMFEDQFEKFNLANWKVNEYIANLRKGLAPTVCIVH